MVCGDDIQPVVEQGFPEGSFVFWCFDSRVAFDFVAKGCVIICGEMQVVDAYFRGDSFFSEG
jgi:hypothetical protein